MFSMVIRFMIVLASMLSRSKSAPKRARQHICCVEPLEARSLLAGGMPTMGWDPAIMDNNSAVIWNKYSWGNPRVPYFQGQEVTLANYSIEAINDELQVTGAAFHTDRNGEDWRRVLSDKPEAFSLWVDAKDDIPGADTKVATGTLASDGVVRMKEFPDYTVFADSKRESTLLELRGKIKDKIADEVFSAWGGRIALTVNPEFRLRTVFDQQDIPQQRIQDNTWPWTAIIVQGGVLVPALDGANPTRQVVAGGQQIVAGKYKFTATGGDSVISDLKFRSQDYSPAAITDAVLKDGNTVLATVPFDNANGVFNFTGLNLKVPQNTIKTLTIAFDLSPAISSTTGTSGVNVASVLQYMKYNNGYVDYDQWFWLAANDILVYKSVPTFTSAALTSPPVLTSGATLDIYSFKVAADPHGDVALKQLVLNESIVSPSGSAKLGSFQFYQDGIDITSLVKITDGTGANLETNGTLAAGWSQLYITWETEDVIPASTVHKYLLRAKPSDIKNGDAIGTVLPADWGKPWQVNNLATDKNGVVRIITGNGEPVDAATIWSDISAINGHGDLSNDWATGYLLPGLPLNWQYTGPFPQGGGMG